MGANPVEALKAELYAINIQDGLAVRAIAAKVDALDDPDEIREVCAQSRALRTALGKLRAEALSVLLARNDRDEFMRRAADREYMSHVELEMLRVPRFLAVESVECACSQRTMVPYDKQGGPPVAFECVGCAAPYLARPAYDGGGYALVVEPDVRPAKKRKRRALL